MGSADQNTDVVLLKLVRDSGVITNEQLFWFATRQGVPSSSFYSSRDRLEKTGLVEIVDFPIEKYRIYAITKLGLMELEHQHEYLLTLTSESKLTIERDKILHTLAVNDISRQFLIEFGIQWWLTEVRVREERFTSGRFVKEYDVLFVIDRSGAGRRPLTVAVEHERTPKAKDRYQEITTALGREKTIDLLLYFCGAAQLMPLILENVQPSNVRVCSSVARSFVRYGKECPVLCWWTGDKLLPISIGSLINRLN